MPVVNSPQQAIALAKINLRRTLGTVDAVALQLVIRGKGELLVTTRTVLSSPGNGKFYRSRKPGGGIHQASAPGEAPAPDTGKYRASIITRAGKGAPNIYFLGVGSQKDFARELEYGRPGGTRPPMAPRPHYRVAMQSWLATRYIPFIRTRFPAAQRAAARGQPITLQMVGYRGQTISSTGISRSIFKL